MPGIDYSGITRTLAETLQAADETREVRVFLEQDPQMGMLDSGIAVAIYLMGRQADPSQSIAAGKRLRYFVRISLVCFGFDAESFANAESKRDELIANVELVVMKNRTIGGKVSALLIEGGDFVSARGPGGNPFVAAGDVTLVCEATATNS